jgi:hypothetical protein
MEVAGGFILWSLGKYPGISAFVQSRSERDSGLFCAPWSWTFMKLDANPRAEG